MTVPVIYELVYLCTSITFLVGSVLFLPSFGVVGVDIGCDLYIIGSVVLAGLTAFDLFGDLLKACGVGAGEAAAAQAGAESPESAASPLSRSASASVRKRRTIRTSVVSATTTASSPAAQQQVETEYDVVDLDNAVVEKLLYLIGSITFAVGTFYWQHPRTTGRYMSTEKEQVLYWAIGLFILGSVFFVLAAFLNALSLSTTHLTFTQWAVVTCSVYELGGILYVIGSVCFMPNQHCGELMEELGAWNFILGSFCYVFGGSVEFMKTVALLFLQRQEELAVQTIARAWRRRSLAKATRQRASEAASLRRSQEEACLRSELAASLGATVREARGAAEPRPERRPLLAAEGSERLPAVCEGRERDGEGEVWNIHDDDEDAAEAAAEAPSEPAAAAPAEAAAPEAAAAPAPAEAPQLPAGAAAAGRAAPEASPPAAAAAVEAPAEEAAPPAPEQPPPLPAPACAPSPCSEGSTAEPEARTPPPGQASQSSSPSDAVPSPASGFEETCDCGAAFAEDALFCERCGARRRELVRQPAAACACGSLFNEGALFCRMCGAKRPEVCIARAEPPQAAGREARRLHTDQPPRRSGSQEADAPVLRRMKTEHPPRRGNSDEVDVRPQQHSSGGSQHPVLPVGRPRQGGRALDPPQGASRQGTADPPPGLVATFVRAVMHDPREAAAEGPARRRPRSMEPRPSVPHHGPAEWRRSSTHRTLESEPGAVYVEMMNDPQAHVRRGQQESSRNVQMEAGPGAAPPAPERFGGAGLPRGRAAGNGSDPTPLLPRSNAPARREPPSASSPKGAAAGHPGLLSTFMEAVRAPHEHESLADEP